MGRVSTIFVPGLDLWFNSSDHLPPHFHARKSGKWEARVVIMECFGGHLEYTMKWPRRGDLPARDRRALLAQTLAQREALLEEWERKVVVREEQ